MLDLIFHRRGVVTVLTQICLVSGCRLSNPVAVVILQVVVLPMIFKVSHLGVTGWVILPAAQLM